MKILSAADVALASPYPALIESLRQGFRADIATPVRHHHDISAEATLLLMPAWSTEFTGLKTVVVKTDNPQKGLPTITASYLLIDNDTGAAIAMMDGTELTRRRTACASALAASYLARDDAATLALIGTGALAPHFARAHAAVRPIKRVFLYNRTPGKAEAVARELDRDGIEPRIVTDPEYAVRKADIVSCITTSTAAIVKGQWLKPGTHVDLAGAFRPQMREVDGETVARSRVYVDTRDGAAAEAGDLLQARDEGRFDFAAVQGDLFELCRRTVAGRRDAEEITLFKSCGTAIEDLAAASLIYRSS